MNCFPFSSVHSSNIDIIIVIIHIYCCLKDNCIINFIFLYENLNDKCWVERYEEAYWMNVSMEDEMKNASKLMQERGTTWQSQSIWLFHAEGYSTFLPFVIILWTINFLFLPRNTNFISIIYAISAGYDLNVLTFIA